MIELDRLREILKLPMEEQGAAMARLDWTIDPHSGKLNSSRAFVTLCDEVESLIRADAHALIAGNAGSTARLIVAQLAHVHGLAPPSEGRGQ